MVPGSFWIVEDFPTVKKVYRESPVPQMIRIYHWWLGQIEKSKDRCLVLCGLPMMANSDPDTVRQIFCLPYSTNDKFFLRNNGIFQVRNFIFKLARRPGPVAQPVASQIADPGLVSLILT